MVSRKLVYKMVYSLIVLKIPPLKLEGLMIHQLRSLYSLASQVFGQHQAFFPQKMLGVLAVKGAPAPLVPNIHALFATCPAAGSASVCGVREGTWLAELGGNTCMVWLEWDPDAVHSTTLLITAMTWQEVQHQAGTTAENAQGLLGRAPEVPKETLSSFLCGRSGSWSPGRASGHCFKFSLKARYWIWALMQPLAGCTRGFLLLMSVCFNFYIIVVFFFISGLACEDES